MNHIMMFKSPWLSLHHPLIVIVPLHVLVVYHLIQNTTLVVSPTLLTSALTCTSSPNLSIFNHSLSNIWGKTRGKGWDLFVWLINRPTWNTTSQWSHVCDYVIACASGGRGGFCHQVFHLTKYTNQNYNNNIYKHLLYFCVFLSKWK